MTDKVRRRSEMVISTSSLPPDDDAYEVIGVFHGETVAGVNFIRDSFAGIRDIIGGRSETCEAPTAIML